MAKLLYDAERLIFQISDRRLQGSAVPVRAILKDTFEHIERLYDRKPSYAEISMDNSVYSTPIVANNVLYIANRTTLFAIAPESK